MKTSITFADMALAKRALGELYSKTEHVNFVDHGYDNLVALVDETYAVRFPRNANAYIRSNYEKQVLESLKSIRTVAIPKIVGEHTNPPCLVTSFLHGTHLNPQQLRKLPVTLQQEFGQNIASFAYELHTALSVDEVRQLRKTLGLDELFEEPWDTYFKRTLFETQLPTSVQDAFAKSYYKAWQELDKTSSLVVVHDDLHTANMLFQDNHLVGILDFGDTNIGTPEEELRQLYQINETVLVAAIETYNQLSGSQLDIQAIKIWAIIQELGAYSSRLSNNKIDHPAFARACHNLNTWIPDGKWGNDILTPDISQDQ